MDNNTHRIGWKFDNSYARLPDQFYTRMDPVPVQNPQIVIQNQVLADELGLTLNDVTDGELAQLFSGNIIPEGTDPIAQAYAGHQFGHFTMLGDGRAHVIGEHITPSGQRVDIQLKGSGRTPYSRGGDGRAVLGPMLREYIISEAMHALGIPTTLSLAVVTTGEQVVRDEILPGAILARVAASHIRVGTFQYAARLGDKMLLQQLADYTIERHYPHIAGSDQPYIDLLSAVMDNQIKLVTEWLRVGFIHGVMNTDNMTISGETIDYGPCAFMDAYDPQTVFSSIDHRGRYAYSNQPPIAAWNLARLAETLLPLIHDDQEKAISMAQDVLHSFEGKFQQQWLQMMRRKLGLLTEEKEDDKLIGDLLQWMQQNHADFTNTFRDLSTAQLPDNKIYQDSTFTEWHTRWQDRLSRHQQLLSSSWELMQNTNPAFIPRNHRVEAALRTAEEHNDFSVFQNLLDVLSEPYQDKIQYEDFKTPPTPGERVHQTFCGT